MKKWPAILLGLFLIASTASTAFAGNGVERGSLDYSAITLPVQVQSFLEKIIFENCSVKGAANIHVVFVSTDQQTDQLSQRFRVELAVSFRDAAPQKNILADILIRHGDQSRVELLGLNSELCRRL